MFRSYIYDLRFQKWSSGLPQFGHSSSNIVMTSTLHLNPLPLMLSFSFPILNSLVISIPFLLLIHSLSPFYFSHHLLPLSPSSLILQFPLLHFLFLIPFHCSSLLLSLPFLFYFSVTLVSEGFTASILLAWLTPRSSSWLQYVALTCRQNCIRLLVPEKQHSSYSPPWKHQISHGISSPRPQVRI
jgi:hypothetical protein